MTWNYRILYTEINGEEEYCIHEVYYDENMNIYAISEDETYFPGGSTIEELKTEMYNMFSAFENPVLNKKSLLNDFEKRRRSIAKKKKIDSI